MTARPPSPYEKLPSKRPTLIALNLVENLRRLVEGSDDWRIKDEIKFDFFLFLWNCKWNYKIGFLRDILSIKDAYMNPLKRTSF